MSVSEFFGDIAHANFTHAYERAKDWWNTGAPQWLKGFVAKAETDGGKFLATLVDVAAQDVLAGGMKTDSFVTAGKDVLAKVQTEGYALSMQEVMAALNLAVNALQQKNNIPAPSPEPAPAA